MRKTFDESGDSNSINEQLQSIAESSHIKNARETDEEFADRKQRQSEVLNRFNETALYNIKLSIFGEAARKNVEVETILEDKKLVKGAVFEIYAIIEYESKHMKKPADEHTLSIGQEIAFLYKFPPVKLADKLKFMRNPDLIEIETDTQEEAVYLKKTVEATTAKLDERKYKQLTETEQALEELVELIDQIPEAYAKKYTPTLLEFRGKIKVKEGIDRTLILSADKDVANRATFISDEVQSIGKHKLMENLLIELDDVEIITSAFSSEDIDNYVDFFTDKLKESL